MNEGKVKLRDGEVPSNRGAGATIASDRDTLYMSSERKGHDFQFDESVARVLPDMLRRSIPGYATLLQMTGVLAGHRLTEGARVYDLGCSLGAVSLAIRHAVGAKNIHIVAVDQSEAMVTRCREVMSADSALCPVEVIQGDIQRLQLEPCSMVVLNFTLQFVPRESRQEIISRIWNALAPGGCLILSEKTHPEHTSEAEFFTESHDAFRRSNGYSQLELSRKREALERVLISESSGAYRKMLTKAGFSTIEWFRCLYFVSWVAEKPHT